MGSSLAMGCSSWFDVCVCGSCEGGVKGDEGWGRLFQNGLFVKISLLGM